MPPILEKTSKNGLNCNKKVLKTYILVKIITKCVKIILTVNKPKKLKKEVRIC